LYLYSSTSQTCNIAVQLLCVQRRTGRHAAVRLALNAQLGVPAGPLRPTALHFKAWAPYLLPSFAGRSHRVTMSPASTPSADSSPPPPSDQPILTSVDPGPAAPRQACDTCKARKIRCERSDTTVPSAGESQRCHACKKHGFPCTADHRAKKRGPRPKVTGRQLLGRDKERPLRPRHAQTAMDGNGAVAETIGDRPTRGSAGRGREDGPSAPVSTFRDADAISVLPGLGAGVALQDTSPVAVNVSRHACPRYSQVILA
jgi:hypothetical protein